MLEIGKGRETRTDMLVSKGAEGKGRKVPKAKEERKLEDFDLIYPIGKAKTAHRIVCGRAGLSIFPTAGRRRQGLPTKKEIIELDVGIPGLPTSNSAASSNARWIRVFCGEPATLSHDRRMKPERGRAMEGKLEVQFPIEGFRAGEEGGQNTLKNRDAEHHRVRAARGMVATVGRMPELIRGGIVGSNGCRGTQREEVPAIGRKSG